MSYVLSPMFYVVSPMSYDLVAQGECNELTRILVVPNFQTRIRFLSGAQQEYVS
jgi:hypothetical protein